MVLAELGGKLRSSLSRLTSSRGAISSEDLDALLLDLSRALIESDVSVKLVGEMRKAIKDRVGRYVKEAEETGAGGGGWGGGGSGGGGRGGGGRGLNVSDVCPVLKLGINSYTCI